MHLSYNNLFDVLESGFRVKYSTLYFWTETALVRVVSELKILISVQPLIQWPYNCYSAPWTVLCIRGTVTGLYLILLGNLSLFPWVTFNQMKLAFHMDCLKSQLLVDTYLICICSPFDPSFRKKNKNISYSNADDTQLYIPVSANSPNLVNDLIQYMVMSNIGWLKISTAKWGQNRLFL